MSKPKLFSGMFFLVGLLAACSKEVPRQPLQWREEVELSDGRIVWVERTASADGMREMGGPSGIKNQHYSLRFTPPGESPLPEWQGEHQPMVFDYDSKNNRWYIVSSFFYGCETWLKLEQPKFPYIEYVLNNGAWQRIPLDEQLVGHKANMYGEIDFENGEPSSIGLQQKSMQRIGSWEMVYQRIITLDEVKSNYNYTEKCKNISLLICNERGFKDCTTIDYKEGLSKW